MHYYRLIEHKRELEVLFDKNPTEQLRRQITFIVKELCRLHETDEGIKSGRCNQVSYKIITFPQYQLDGKKYKF